MGLLNSMKKAASYISPGYALVSNWDKVAPFLGLAEDKQKRQERTQELINLIWQNTKLSPSEEQFFNQLAQQQSNMIMSQQALQGTGGSSIGSQQLQSLLNAIAGQKAKLAFMRGLDIGRLALGEQSQLTQEEKLRQAFLAMLFDALGKTGSNVGEALVGSGGGTDIAALLGI